MLRLTILTAAIAAIFLFSSSAQIFRFSDDFSRYPIGSAGEPNWEVNNIGFEIRDGKLVAEIPSGRSYSILTKSPLARTVTVEATVTVH
ncbi:MAG: hypothetical protein RMK89_08575, partial [Armatimonadota bacterium]|nr:hypothetical protein [Armatimonadota bacterium]MDW8143500.1 hypothetical protein [Armatimonadota bacterium]